MGGVSATADISDSQLQGQAGGPVLQSASLLASAQTSKKPPRKLCENFQAGFGMGPVTVPLLLLICQQLDATLFQDIDPQQPTSLKVRRAWALLWLCSVCRRHFEDGSCERWRRESCVICSCGHAHMCGDCTLPLIFF